MQRTALAAGATLLVACTSSAPIPDTPATATPSTATPPAAATAATGFPSSSKYYKDDGPGDSPPANLEQIPDAMPRLEPIHRFANRPYTVLGRDYVPATALRPYRERGIASWYGRKFHGQKTAIGETYDMYAMTAAHPTLPLPSYARVTNVRTARSVIVRINDRGPFLHGRIIDLSFAAAHKLGIASPGSGEVEVEAILPGEGAMLVAQVPLPPVAAETRSLAIATAPSSAAVVTAPLRSVESPAPIAFARDETVAFAMLAPTTSLRGIDAPLASQAPVVSISRDTARSLLPPAPVSSTPNRKTPLSAYAVQLGAFQNYVNAQSFVAHVQSQLASAQVEPKVREANGLYRVYVGPYTDRDEARRVAERITTAFGMPTAIALH